MAARVTTLSVPFFSPENRIALGDLDAFPLSAARAAGPFASTRSQDSVEVSLYLAAFTFVSPFFFAYYRQTFSFLSLFPFSLFFLSIGLHFFRKVERLAEYARRNVFFFCILFDATFYSYFVRWRCYYLVVMSGISRSFSGLHFTWTPAFPSLPPLLCFFIARRLSARACEGR